MRTILCFVIGSWLLHQYVPLQCYVKRHYGEIWYYFLPKRRRIATKPFNYSCFSLSLVTVGLQGVLLILTVWLEKHAHLRYQL